MAIGAERRRRPRRRWSPSGLNFDRKTAFRSRVTVLYGQPFSVADLAADGEQAAVRLATDADRRTRCGGCWSRRIPAAMRRW